MKKVISILFISVLVVFSCKKEKAEEPTTPTPTPLVVSFATDVQPIFAASCGTGNTCHGTSSAANNKVYETHTGAEAVSGAKTKGAINHSSGFDAMPKNSSKLSSTNIEIIEAWIDGGMLND